LEEKIWSEYQKLDESGRDEDALAEMAAAVKGFTAAGPQ
jgi:hypothetical protein